MSGNNLICVLLLVLLMPALHACGGKNMPAGNGSKPEVAVVNDEPDPLKGLKLYLGYCFVCHGQTGDGNGPYASMLSATPSDFTDSTYFGTKTDEELYDFISKGGIAHGKSMHMKPFGFQMTPDEIQSTIAYIRVLNRHERINRDKQSNLSGQEIYRNSCVMCHGEKGSGEGRLSKMLGLKVRPMNAEQLSEFSGAKLYNIVQDGMPSDTTGSGRFMPAWGNSLSEKEIIDVISYINTF